MSDTGYSVLISVYRGTDPVYLEKSLESIFSQTVPSDDIVVVTDGPVSEEVEKVLSGYENSINLVRLTENRGLGDALNEGLKHCRYELVARMDDDDISLPDRMEKQLQAFEKDPALDLLSGTVEEFRSEPGDVQGARRLPSEHEEILAFSKKRNPFNHPAIMMRKSSVLEAGGYNGEYPLFEDYSLWIRMLMRGSIGRNLPDTLVYMRVDDNTYLRRGGFSYAGDMLRFHRMLRRKKWTTMGDYMTGALPHALVCILPNALRKKIYKKLH